jgi:hypothetical protein
MVFICVAVIGVGPWKIRRIICMLCSGRHEQTHSWESCDDVDLVGLSPAPGVEQPLQRRINRPVISGVCWLRVLEVTTSPWLSRRVCEISPTGYAVFLLLQRSLDVSRKLSLRLAGLACLGLLGCWIRRAHARRPATSSASGRVKRPA